MSWVQSYRMRLRRKGWQVRAFRKRRELVPVADRTEGIRPNDILIGLVILDHDELGLVGDGL